MKYFSKQIYRNKIALKRAYHRKAHELHPDKFPESEFKERQAAFQEMLAEYQSIKSNTTVAADNPLAETEKINKQAQTIFHALTNLQSVDVNLLASTIKQVTNWDKLTEVFAKKYAIGLLPLAISKITDNQKRHEIYTLISKLQAEQTHDLVNSVFDTLGNIFKK